MTLATVTLATALALSATAALAQSSGTSFGQSVPPVGTVTAPSVGSYYWPSVGTTNAVPTWNNTTPPARSGVVSGAPATGAAPIGAGRRG
ncbi:MAG TPA: hypothetical protein VKY22_29255 [Bradyrhizobium sp.]|nr:hypothetical protein [Bradyrhizobium sp.]